jgi:hypothetical protein
MLFEVALLSLNFALRVQWAKWCSRLASIAEPLVFVLPVTSLGDADAAVCHSIRVFDQLISHAAR